MKAWKWLYIGTYVSAGSHSCWWCLWCRHMGIWDCVGVGRRWWVLLLCWCNTVWWLNYWLLWFIAAMWGTNHHLNFRTRWRASWHSIRLLVVVEHWCCLDGIVWYEGKWWRNAAWCWRHWIGVLWSSFLWFLVDTLIGQASTAALWTNWIKAVTFTVGFSVVFGELRY